MLARDPYRPGKIAEIEHALIGACLIDARGIKAWPLLNPDEFYMERHRKIWSVMLGLAEGTDNPDPLLVADELARRDELEEVGGVEKLAQMTEAGINVLDLGYYGRCVREASKEREKIMLAAELFQRPDMSSEEIEAVLAKLETGSAIRAPLLSESWLAEQERLRQNPPVKTGYKALDSLIQGCSRGKMIIVGGRTSHGKCLALDTWLATPSGWTTMGAVQVGDRLIGADGSPVRVLYASPVKVGLQCYSVRFSDGTEIVTDADHEWLTWTWAARKSALRRPEPSRTSVYSRDQRAKMIRPAVVTTRHIAETVRIGTYDKRLNHCVALSRPLRLEEADLQIDPYILGVWLGNGSTSTPCFYSSDPDIPVAIIQRGQPVRRQRLKNPRACPAYWLSGLGRKLRAVGVLGRKHIPMVYLRASESQRRALLAGLLDTDGMVNYDGSVGLDLTCTQLASDARDLIASLGYRVTMSRRLVKGRTEETSTCERLRFLSEEPVFFLERKARRHKAAWSSLRRRRNESRMIVSVTPVPSVPVRCVQVDSENHLYLASRSFIPTHNTSFLTDFTRRAARNGHSVDYLSLEETAAGVHARWIAQEAALPVWAVSQGRLGPIDRSRADAAVEELQVLPMTALTVKRPDEASIVAAVKASRAEIFVLDHLQMAVTSGREPRTYGLERLLNRIAYVGVIENKILIVASQLSREMDKRRDRPVLSDLRDSGGTEQAGRLILLLYWPRKYHADKDPSYYEVEVAKHTEGPTGSIVLTYDAVTGRFHGGEGFDGVRRPETMGLFG